MALSALALAAAKHAVVRASERGDSAETERGDSVETAHGDSAETARGDNVETERQMVEENLTLLKELEELKTEIVDLYEIRFLSCVDKYTW